VGVLQKLSEKVALVTGAGSGIGAATARLFSAHGARLALLSHIADEVATIAAHIEQGGGEVLPLMADVSQSEDLVWAFDQIRDRWGRLDVVFANAGVNGVWAPLDQLSVEEWDSTLKINLGGTFLTLKFALPLLKVRGGAVVITSSVNGRTFHNAGATAYACSKAAQVALAKMAALELSQHHIRVNVICPGWFDTHIEAGKEQRNLTLVRQHTTYPEGPVPLTGLRPGQAEQAAKLALFLASDDSDHITGTEVYIDGAESLQ
jgi:NAD(P)-dependent dehydrogenase (short-subunit alcohol dehydrogenase family)